MKVFVLNGWAAKEAAWKKCAFRRDRIFSWVEQLDGAADEAVAAEKGGVALVGWSMGGTNALRIAAAMPKRIKGLVLIGATARMTAADNWKGLSPKRLAALDFALKHGGSPAAELAGMDYTAVYDAEDARNLARGLDFLRDTDLRVALIDLLASGALNCPVHVFQSESDAVVRPENARFLAAVFPGAAVHMIPGSEHALPLSIPGMIDEAVDGL